MKNLISTQAMQNAHAIKNATGKDFAACPKLGWKVAKKEISFRQAATVKKFSFNSLLDNLGEISETGLLSGILFVIAGILFGVTQANTNLTFNYYLIAVSCIALGVAAYNPSFKSLFVEVNQAT